ncbi:MAG: ATP-binding protein [Vicinamibacterales bacterium]
MATTIRARLTLWYSLVLFVTLAATAVALVALHARLGLNRIDRELADTLVTVSHGLDHELDEGLDLPHAVADALTELEVPGTGVAILDPAGAIVGARASAVALLLDAQIRQMAAGPGPQTLNDGGVRARAAPHQRGGYTMTQVVWTSLAPFDAERATVRRTLFLAMPAGLLLAALGGWAVCWRALAPLSAMARQANAIDDRALAARLIVRDADDELSALAVAFNGLLDRLGHAFQTQRRFMADASHQLRTPLSITRIAAQVTLAQPDRSVDEYRSSLQTVAQQTERMTRMVDDMFALALADLDARPLQLEELYLNEIVTDCVSAAQVLAGARSVSLRATTADDVQMLADESLLRQMILNLVENAVRHTPPHGSVQVSLDADADRARIAVSDTGPGIAAIDRERIFERFVRLDAGGTDGGGGLGLPIARWVAQLHRGTLTLDASGPGGSRFVALLPLR